MKKMIFPMLAATLLAACNTEDLNTDWTTAHQGSYTGTMACVGSSPQQQTIILTRTSDTKLVDDDGIYLDMISETDFEILPQFNQGAIYEGNGSFSGQQISVGLSVTQGGNSFTCSFTGTK